MIVTVGKGDCPRRRKAWPGIAWAEIATQLNILRRLAHRGGYDAAEFRVDVAEDGTLKPIWVDLDAAEAIGAGETGMAPVMICLSRDPDGTRTLSFMEDGREITNAQACLSVAENLATFIASERGDATMNSVLITIGTGRNALDVEIDVGGAFETWTAPNMRQAQPEQEDKNQPEM